MTPNRDRIMEVAVDETGHNKINDYKMAEFDNVDNRI
jgi:hypothetical protein